MAEENNSEVHPDFNKESSTNMEPRIAVLIAYLFSWLGALIIMLLEKENKFVKWHSIQALIIGIIEVAAIIVISVILGLIPYIGWFLFSWLGWLIAGVAWVFAIIALVMAFQGKTFRIPVVAKLADKYFKME